MQSRLTSRTSTRTTTQTADLSKSLPPQTQTFEQFRQSRQEKISQAQEDAKALKERELHDLQHKLQDLILKINAAQSTLAAEERDYTSEKETLITELKRIKIEAETKSAESRRQHLQNMENLQQQHETALKEFAESLQNLQMPPQESDDNSEVERARTQLRSAQTKYRNSQMENVNQTEEPINQSQFDGLYIAQIAELESKKRDLIRTLKDEEMTNKQRVTEMTMLLDDQETQFQREIQALQSEMQKKEEKYQNELNKLFAELDRTQMKRQATVETRKEKIANIQQQIDATENEFKEKLRQANRVAEKLKAALVNANLRKSQQLELERKRSQEQQDLLRESYSIQQNIGKLTKELEKAKKESAFLRRELSAKIGPRRTASLFA